MKKFLIALNLFEYFVNSFFHLKSSKTKEAKLNKSMSSKKSLLCKFDYVESHFLV